MKKRLFCLLSLMLLLASSAFAVNLSVDGKTLNPDVAPIIENGRTLVPVRAIFESIGATVTWDNATRTVTAVKGEITVKLIIDDTTAYVNDTPKTLDVPARLVDGRTLVPARFVAEAMNAEVWWDDETKTAYVATVSNYDGYRVAPNDIFTKETADASMIGTNMYLDATVVSSQDLADGTRGYLFKTDLGQLYITNVPNPLPEGKTMQAGNTYRICFRYDGFSDTLQVPTGTFMELGDMSIIPHMSNQWLLWYTQNND